MQSNDGVQSNDGGQSSHATQGNDGVQSNDGVHAADDWLRYPVHGSNRTGPRGFSKSKGSI